MRLLLFIFLLVSISLAVVSCRKEQKVIHKNTFTAVCSSKQVNTCTYRAINKNYPKRMVQCDGNHSITLTMKQIGHVFDQCRKSVQQQIPEAIRQRINKIRNACKEKINLAKNNKVQLKAIERECSKSLLNIAHSIHQNCPKRYVCNDGWQWRYNYYFSK